jgi:hypothetical protein
LARLRNTRFFAELHQHLGRRTRREFFDTIDRPP